MKTTARIKSSHKILRRYDMEEHHWYKDVWINHDECMINRGMLMYCGKEVTVIPLKLPLRGQYDYQLTSEEYCFDYPRHWLEDVREV